MAIPNNNITDLHPDLVRVYTEAKAAYHLAHPQGRRVELNETHRSLAVQQAYYAQGRQSLAEINRLRKRAGLWAIGAAEAASEVTWKLPGTSKHGTYPAQAFDVRMINRQTGKADWSAAPFDLFATFVRDAAIKLGIGVSIGAFWKKKKDRPHVELA